MRRVQCGHRLQLLLLLLLRDVRGGTLGAEEPVGTLSGHIIPPVHTHQSQTKCEKRKRNYSKTPTDTKGKESTSWRGNGVGGGGGLVSRGQCCYVGCRSPADSHRGRFSARGLGGMREGVRPFEVKTPSPRREVDHSPSRASIEREERQVPLILCSFINITTIRWYLYHNKIDS